LLTIIFYGLLGIHFTGAYFQLFSLVNGLVYMQQVAWWSKGKTVVWVLASRYPNNVWLVPVAEQKILGEVELLFGLPLVV
jgi:hypothetical protein